MIGRIIEAFTRPKMQVTGVDEFWMGVGVVLLLVVVAVLYCGGYLLHEYLTERTVKKE